MTDAEARWLLAWRAMSADEQTVAERMIAGLTGPRVANQHESADQRSMMSERGLVRAFAKDSPTEETSMAAAR